MIHWRWVLVVIGLWMHTALAGMPEEIAEYTRQHITAGREAGGEPELSGVQTPEAGQVTHERPPYLTATDLNHDGRPDDVIDLAGLECARAWGCFLPNDLPIRPVARRRRLPPQ